MEVDHKVRTREISLTYEYRIQRRLSECFQKNKNVWQSTKEKSPAPVSAQIVPRSTLPILEVSRRRRPARPLGSTRVLGPGGATSWKRRRLFEA